MEIWSKVRNDYYLIIYQNLSRPSGRLKFYFFKKKKTTIYYGEAPEIL